MLCTFGEEVGLKKQLLRLISFQGSETGLPRGAGHCLPPLTSLLAPSCSHRRFPSTLQLQEMLVEKLCLLLEPPQQR